MNYLLGTPAYRPKAIDGSYLSGGRLVRFIYLDEGGTNKEEPFTVVAGIVVNADTEWDKLEAAIDSLRPRVPEKIRKDFYFHATDIFSGSKKAPDGTRWKDFWPLNERVALLEDFVSIPRKFSVGVALGYAKRGRAGGNWSGDDAARVEHLMAFGDSIIAAAEFLGDQCPGENAILVVENHKEMKGKLRKIPAALRNPEAPKGWVGDAPLSRIKDVPHFCEKSEAVLLQLADACAFVIRGFLAKHPKNKPLYLALMGTTRHFMGDKAGAASGRFYQTWRTVWKSHP